MINELKFFKHEEFDSPDLPGSGAQMNPELLNLLDQLRGKCGFPLKINSGFRTAEHNAKVGGKPDSAHTKGLAADIACTDGHSRFIIIKYAYELGFKRIEAAPTWVHLDMDFSKPQEVLFYPT